MSKYNLEERYKDFPSRIEGELWEGFGLGGASGITQPEGVQIRNVRSLGTDDDTQIIYAELMVDDETDLPAADSITGYLLSGCIALVVHTGDIWAQDSEGAWYNQTDPEVLTTSVQSSTRFSEPQIVDFPDNGLKKKSGDEDEEYFDDDDEFDDLDDDYDDDDMR